MMTFATVHFDMHKVVKLLQDKGFSEEQAIGFMTAMQEITLSGVATQAYIIDLRSNIQELKDEMNHFKSENMKFMMIQFIALVGVMVALAAFF